MNDRPGFESQLRLALSAYAGDAPVDVDPTAMAAFAAHAGTRSHGRALPRRWLLTLAFGALVAAMVAGALLVGSRLPRPAVATGPLTIRQTDTMSVTRAGASAVELGDGRILVAGGYNGYPPERGDQWSADIYDPATGVFTPTDRMTEGRRDASATRPADGRVLILGGRQSSTILTSADLFDPATSTFTPVGSMGTGRAGHAAVLLTDGRVAIIGGETEPGISGGSVAAKPDVVYYDVANDQYTAGPSDRGLEWLDPSAAVLPDGRILIGRGSLEYGVGPASGPVILDPDDGLVTPAVEGTDLAFGYVTSLPDGRALIAASGVTRNRWRIVRRERDGTVDGVADLPAAPVAPLTALADGRVLILVDERCETIDAYVLDVDRMALAKIGTIDGLGACNSWDGTTVTALRSGGALIAGGNSAGGESSADAWLVETTEGSDTRQP